VLTLGDVAANCNASDPNPRTIPVAYGGAVTVAFQVACAPISLLVFAAPSDGEIYAINSNGTGATRLTRSPEVDEDPAWSPDGSEIAFTSRRDGQRQIFLMKTDGSRVQQLTTGPAANYQPAWSPQGDRLVFVSERDGNPELYVLHADGTNPIRVTNHPAADTDPAWSITGKLAFTSNRNGISEIYVSNSDGSAVTRVTFASIRALHHPAWSPDGTRLALAVDCIDRTPPCNSRIFVMNADGSGLTDLRVAGDAPVWSSDGRKLAYSRHACDYYYDGGCNLAGIGIVRVDLTGSMEIMELPAARTPDWRR
jgi:Tol biopolymer transport system component